MKCYTIVITIEKDDVQAPTVAMSDDLNFTRQKELEDGLAALSDAEESFAELVAAAREGDDD